MNKFTDLDKEQFDALVQAEVEKQLSSREEAQARIEWEEVLKEAKETFETMKASIEVKDAKIKEYEEILANLDLNPTAADVAANEKVVALEASLEEWKRRAEVAEGALVMLEKDDTAASRMSDLENAGVALDDDKAEAQYSKVREMSDEEFDAYKQELVALKSKYASASDETDEDANVSELSETEVANIAQTIGCDPKDDKCLSIVRDVAKTMAAFSKKRKKPEMEQDCGNENANADNKELKKETASEKLSFSEALTKAVNREVQAPSSLTDEISQAWVGYMAEKRGEKKR